MIFVDRRPPARGTASHPGVAVVLGPGGRRRRRRLVLAAVSAALRSRAHLPFLQADVEVDRPSAPQPEAADRWTAIVLVAYAQLRLARPLAEDLRRPWERPVPSTRLTPARVRRGFSRTRASMPVPARAPKPSRPGPGRPPGSKNTHCAPHHHVGKHAETQARKPVGATRPG